MVKIGYEYLREFEQEFEFVLGYELGVQMGSIHEKNQGPKISCFCTFKGLFRRKLRWVKSGITQYLFDCHLAADVFILFKGTPYF